MVNLGASLLRGFDERRTTRRFAPGRLSVLVGSCGVVLATSGGCLEAPNKTLTASGGQSFGGGAGLALGAGRGGTQAGSALGGGAGADRVGAGTGGHHSHPGGAGVGGAATGEAGAGSDAGGGSDTGGGSNTGGSDNPGGASGEAGVDGTAGAPQNVAGAGGLGPMGGAAGTGHAGTSTGGFAGNDGDVEEPFDGPCPGSVMNGWATVAGLDFDPAASSAAAPEVVVTDAATLVSYASSPDPYVIRISGTIAVPALDLTSNKTIMGDDSLAVFQGGIRILGTSIDPSDMISNVVIKNLQIDATTSATATTADEDDGIMVAYGHHVWIDHVDVWDASGDDLSISNGSDYITVSWSKFRFVNGLRRTAARVGHSDTNAPEDTGRLNVTFHHNWWTDNIDQRMPRVRFGAVHVFDNYYSNRNTNYPDNTYCIAAGYEADLLVENNFFDEAYNPHVFFSFLNGVGAYVEPTAQMVANDNTYVGVSDLADGKQSGQGAAFVPPYSVTLEPADDVLRNTIRHCAGVVQPASN